MRQATFTNLNCDLYIPVIFGSRDYCSPDNFQTERDNLQFWDIENIHGKHVCASIGLLNFGSFSQANVTQTE